MISQNTYTKNAKLDINLGQEQREINVNRAVILGKAFIKY